MERLKHHRIDSLLIWLGGLWLFTVGLSHQEIVSFESRFYLFALEMWRHDVSWFPTTYGKPYPDYPVTATLLIYFSAKLFHSLNKFVAVFPSAVASALVLMVTYKIGALHQRLWGWLAAGFLLFCSAFLMEARTISLDQFVTLVTVSCFYLVYSATWLKKNVSLFALIVLLVIGFAFRGPIGLIIPTGVVCSFYLIAGDYKKIIIVGIASMLTLMLSVAFLLLIAYHVGGLTFMHNVLAMEVLSRVHDAHSPAWYYYLPVGLSSYAIVFPLMLIMLPSLLFIQQDKKFLLQLLGWVAIILFGLSIVGDKKIRYILPIAPALALFCVYLLVGPIKNNYLYWLRKIFYGFCAVFPAISLAVLFICHQRFSLTLPYVALSLAFMLLQVLILIAFGIFRSLISIFWLALVSFVSMYIFVVEPIAIHLNAARDLVISIEKLRVAQRAKLIFYREHTDGLVVKYLINMPVEEQPIFVATSAELNNYGKDALFITSKEYFLMLPTEHYQIIKAGSIGTNAVVVFKKTR